MTEIVTREAEQLPELQVSSPLAVWAESARRAASVAVSLAKTPFVPQSLRERATNNEPDELARAQAVTAANITAAILTGQEVGLEPMAALRSIDIIQGVPAMRAVALRALVQGKGHQVWVVEQTDTRAIVAGRRRGDEHEQRSMWTMDRARALGLVGKDNWRKQPQAMLVARATSELCRLVAADVILGVPYSIEELQDGDDTVPTDTTPKKRTARRAPAEPVETVQLPEPEVPTAEPIKTVEDAEGQEWPEPPADWQPELGGS